MVVLERVLNSALAERSAMAGREQRLAVVWCGEAAAGAVRLGAGAMVDGRGEAADGVQMEPEMGSDV